MKSILIIDIPNELDVNNLLIDYCVHTKGEYKTIRKGGNHPLKPLPKKTMQEPFCRDIAEAVKLGWDLCLDDILGDTE